MIDKKNRLDRVLDGNWTGSRFDQKIDDIDMQIISLLQEDSRLSFNKIAHKLGISVGTVCNHVKSLEDRVVLKGYTVLVGSNKNSRSYKSVKKGRRHQNLSI